MDPKHRGKYRAELELALHSAARAMLRLDQLDGEGSATVTVDEFISLARGKCVLCPVVPCNFAGELTVSPCDGCNSCHQQ